MTDDFANWYYNGVVNILEGNINWSAGNTNLYMALYSSFSPSQSSDQYYTTGSLPANCTELTTAGGYTRGGVQLPSVAAPAVYSSTNIVLSSGNVVWPGTCTFTGVVAAVIYYTGSGHNYLLGYIDWALTGPKAAQGGTFTVQCPAAGWFEQPITTSS